jgi:hypothetical protein
MGCDFPATATRIRTWTFRTAMSQVRALLLATAMFCCGIAFTMTIQTTGFGFQIGLRNNKKRQKLLNILCMVACMCGTLCYPVNYLEVVPIMSSILTLIFFACIQFALCIVNHNSFVRLLVISNRLQLRYDGILAIYALPLFTMIPIYLAAAENIPQNIRLNLSTWNSMVYKPLNIFLVVGTELIAFVTDVLILRKMRQNISRGLMKMYFVTWTFLLIDIVIKYLIAMGYPLLFDSILSTLTIAMRARVNLKFGLDLKKGIQNKGGDDSSSDSEESSSLRAMKSLKVRSLQFDITAAHVSPIEQSLMFRNKTSEVMPHVKASSLQPGLTPTMSMSGLTHSHTV